MKTFNWKAYHNRTGGKYLTMKERFKRNKQLRKRGLI